MHITQTMTAGMDFHPDFINTEGRKKQFIRKLEEVTRKRLELRPSDTVEIVIR